MKKRIGFKKALVLGLCMMTALGMISLTGCGATGFPYSEYNLDDYIKVGKYKGLEVDGYKIEVTDKEVNAAITQAREAATKDVKLKNGEVLKEGDTVNIDYVGRIDGKKFEGGSDKGYDLTLGSDEFIEGFESRLVGKKVGDKKVKVPVTFPEDYSAADIAGKDAVFTVTINSATRSETPEYNDAFAKTQGDYKNTEEYEKAVKKNLYKQEEEQAISDQKMALWDKVVAKSEIIDYPQEEVDHYKESNSEQMDAIAEEYDVSREKILSQYGFSDEKDFEIANDESSKLRVKQELIVAKIAENEGISYTDEEKDKMIEQFENQGYDDKSMQEQTGRTMDQYVCIQLLYEKVLDFILEEAEVK